VRLAREGEPPQSGVVLLAGTNHHIRLKNGTLAYTAEPVNEIYRPSIDVFFESVAVLERRCGGRAADRHGARRRPRPQTDASTGLFDHRPGPAKQCGVWHAQRRRPSMPLLKSARWKACAPIAGGFANDAFSAAGRQAVFR
jgi:hypothetical protein